MQISAEFVLQEKGSTSTFYVTVIFSPWLAKTLDVFTDLFDINKNIVSKSVKIPFIHIHYMHFNIDKRRQVLSLKRSWM